MPEILNGILREETGKSSSRKARMEGNMPAILYCQIDILAFTVDPKALRKIIKQKGKNALIDLKIKKDSVKNRKVLLKDFQAHPLEETWLHVDFLEVDVKKNIRVYVPVELIGISPGEKLGGILNHIIREVDMECLPEDIPEKVDVSIEKLNLGEAIHISDLEFSEKLKIYNPPSAPIVTVALEKEEVKEEAEGEAAEGVEEAEPEKASDKAEPTAAEGSTEKK
ncbi:MAG: 50S ribosomal protein L25 [Nitrospinota bacterium]|nr:50S ribosomal protein L25 [Nitrospinota bacterium]